MDGLRRYGYDDDADRVARKFIALVTKEFEEHGGIVEKYDVKRRESDVAADIRFGYSANQVGFGWTNGAFLELLAGLEAKTKAKPRAADAGPPALLSGRRLSPAAAPRPLAASPRPPSP